MHHPCRVQDMGGLSPCEGSCVEEPLVEVEQCHLQRSASKMSASHPYSRPLLAPRSKLRLPPALQASPAPGSTGRDEGCCPGWGN